MFSPHVAVGTTDFLVAFLLTIGAQCNWQRYCQICTPATVRTDSTLSVAALTIGMLPRLLLGDITLYL